MSTIDELILITDHERIYVTSIIDVKLDEEEVSKLDPIFKYISRGDLDLVKTEVGKGIDINIIFNPKKGNPVTPLEFSLFYRRDDISLFLIKSGANVNRENIYGDTPLILGCVYKMSEEVCAEFLDPKYKANLNYKNSTGCSALSICLYEGYMDLAKKLILAGAYFNEEAEKKFLPFNAYLIMPCIFEKYRELQNGNSKLKEENTTLKSKNEKLRKKNRHLKYLPGAPGFDKCRTHFKNGDFDLNSSDN